jgi:hypothetical protein
MAVPLLVVDGANVVGSVPDGWWRDRPGAAIRLRDRLVPITTAGMPDLPGPLDVTLVVEGKARDIPEIPEVRLVRAPGSGDDAIVDVVRDDRGLRDRVSALGAETRGPASIPR